MDEKIRKGRTLQRKYMKAWRECIDFFCVLPDKTAIINFLTENASINAVMVSSYMVEEQESELKTYMAMKRAMREASNIMIASFNEEIKRLKADQKAGD